MWEHFDAAVTFNGYVVQTYVVYANYRSLLESQIPEAPTTREEVNSTSGMPNDLRSRKKDLQIAESGLTNLFGTPIIK